MTSTRRNEVSVIANLVPHAIGYLTIPLTPSRAAALAAFTARTGIEAQALVVDLIDDVIFDTGFVASGGASCTEQYAEGSRRPEKSSARSCGAMHDCAVRPSDAPAKGSGHTKRRRNSRLALAAQYARPLTNWQESENRPADRLRQSSLKSAAGRSDLCGNED